MMRFQRDNFVLLIIAICFPLTGCERKEPQSESLSVPNAPETYSTRRMGFYSTAYMASPIVIAARNQIGKTLYYDSAYTSLSYPNGDVPIEKGVCTDVVIRALRDAMNMDLQKLVHEDMNVAFSKYPNIWGLKKPDSNIDHRRVSNLKTYFERQGYSLDVTQEKDNYLPGDLVTCTVGQNQPHIMIVSDRKGPDDIPLVIHNIGRGTQEENRLFEFPLTGHYRIKK